MGHAGISPESSRRPLSNGIKFARIGVRTRGVMAPGSRGVGAVFVHFSGEDSGQTGDAIGEPRVPRRSRSRYLSNAPGLADQLVASRKDSAREGGCPGGKNAFCSQRVFSQILSQFARIFDLAPDVRILTFLVPSESLRCLLLQGSGFAEIRAWTCEIWPREQRPPEVFLVRLRAVFRSGFRLAPVNSWRSESSTSCMNVSSFQRTGLADQLVASQEDSARKRGNVGGKIPELSAKPYFVGLFSRAWPCTEASLGSQDMILANGGRRNVPYAKGGGQFDPVFGLVNDGRSNLGQTWSTLVKLGQTWSKLSKLWEMYPGPHFEGFWAYWTPSRVRNGLVKPRSNLVNPGQTWSTLVKFGQTFKLWEMCSGYLPWEYFETTSPSSDWSGLVRAVPFCVPTPEKIPGVQVIRSMPAPKTEKEIRSFLRRINYIARFIAQLTATCEPLFKLLRKDVKIKWTEDCQKAFDKIKEYLLNPPILVPPTPGRPLILYLTVQEASMGCMLGQQDETGKKEQAIYYLSKKFTEPETRYLLVEKMCCALAWASKKLRQYMLYYTTWLVSRMDPIKYIFEKPTPTGKIARWQVLLSEFDILFVARKAIKGQAIADYLADYPSEQLELMDSEL
uniref:Reverse transcriptase RNase H-like domain-containing protein n=1 Tax=Fagus sylvatica TaxID=28930 RepID=A0A2N9IR81_FAGSY